jgi:hypothetical protein
MESLRRRDFIRLQKRQTGVYFLMLRGENGNPC